MKKLLFTLTVATAGVLFGVTAHAQGESLEAMLPAQVQKSLPSMREDYAFLLTKVAELNPGYKNAAQLPANINTMVDQLRKQKPAYEGFKTPQVVSFDQLIAAKTKQSGAGSSMVKILNILNDNISKANSTSEIVTVMMNLLKSPVFASLSPDDKNSLYYAFAAAKVSFDYMNKNNVAYMAAYNTDIAGPGGDYDDYMPLPRAACMWGWTMAGAIAGCIGGPGGASIGAGIGLMVGNHACG